MRGNDGDERGATIDGTTRQRWCYRQTGEGGRGRRKKERKRVNGRSIFAVVTFAGAVMEVVDAVMAVVDAVMAVVDAVMAICFVPLWCPKSRCDPF